MERKIALEILNNIEKNKAFSNIAINEAIKKNRGADEAFIRYLVYGVLENKIYLDYHISKFISSPIEKVKKNSLNILRMSLFQILYMDSVPDYAVVNEAVELARKTSQYQDKFINGVLRNILRAKGKVKLPDAERYPLKRLSVEFSYPRWLIKYLSDSYGLDFAKKYIKASNETPPLTIRANTLKVTPEELKTKLESEGFEVTNGRISPNALNVKGSRLLETDSFKNGEFSVQDESSMAAVEILEPKPGDFLLDLCAAPGGKAVYAGELMKNQGRITACDLYENKLNIVERTAKSHGIKNLVCEVQDAAKLNEKFLEKADKIICDVPCSGLGVIRRKPEIKYTKSIDDIKELCKIQYAILCNAVKYLKRGGELVYSTCTVSPAENEGIIKYFIKKHENDGYQVCYKKQFLPFEDGTDGFFVAKINKL